MPAQTPRTDAATSRRHLPSALRLIAFAAIIAAAWWWLWRHGGSDPKAWLEAMRATSPWLFISLVATLPAIGFPVFACYLYAGAAFGFLWGWLYCLAGLSLSISLGYWIARTLLRVPLQSLLAAKARHIPAPGERHHLRTVLLARLVPGLTFALQNALLGLLGIPFRTYFAGSLAAQGLLAAIVCAVGSLGQEPYWLSITLIATAAVAICVLAHFGIRRGWRRAPAAGPPPPATPPPRPL